MPFEGIVETETEREGANGRTERRQGIGDLHTGDRINRVCNGGNGDDNIIRCAVVAAHRAREKGLQTQIAFRQGEIVTDLGADTQPHHGQTGGIDGGLSGGSELTGDEFVGNMHIVCGIERINMGRGQMLAGMLPEQRLKGKAGIESKALDTQSHHQRDFHRDHLRAGKELRGGGIAHQVAKVVGIGELLRESTACTGGTITDEETRAEPQLRTGNGRIPYIAEVQRPYSTHLTMQILRGRMQKGRFAATQSERKQVGIFRMGHHTCGTKANEEQYLFHKHEFNKRQ